LEDPGPDLYHSMLTMMLSITTGNFTFELITGIILIFLFLFLSGAISASEIAFFSLTPTQLESIRHNESRRSHIILLLLEKPKRLLATILVADVFVKVITVILASGILVTGIGISITSFIGILLHIIIISALILCIGEIMPKIYATQHNLKVACMMARPLLVARQLFYPFSSILVSSTNIVDKRIAGKGHNLTMGELSEALDLTESDSNTPDEERKILKGIVKFGDIAVREIMRSRVDVTAVDDTANFAELLSTINESGYSRIPIYNDNLDNVTGILYIKDLIPHIKEIDDYSWQPLQRPAFFVPENKHINDLLQEFQAKKIHLAIVVDEYGGTSGIITLEDILEEIVGEISDEFDSESDEIHYTKIDDHTYLFEGKTLLNDFCKVLEIDDRIFQEVKGESDTLAGLVLEMADKIPEADEQFTFNNFTFKPEVVDKRSIKRIRVSITEQTEEE